MSLLLARRSSTAAAQVVRRRNRPSRKDVLFPSLRSLSSLHGVVTGANAHCIQESCESARIEELEVLESKVVYSKHLYGPGTDLPMICSTPPYLSRSWQLINECKSGLVRKSLRPLVDPRWHSHQLSFYSSQRSPSSSSTSKQGSENIKIYSRSIGTTKVPTPPSAPPSPWSPWESLASVTPQKVLKQVLDGTIYIFKTAGLFLLRLPGRAFYYATHPTERKQRMAEIRQMAREELKHYWVGTKLLYGDVITARGLLGKTLQGSSLTRRERKQLLRTVSDLFRVVPFSMFVIIPAAEFALPFALKLFPNLLPSTFQDSLKAEEGMKRELQSRIAMAQFFQETLEELAKEQKRKASKRKKELEGEDVDENWRETIDEQEDSAASMLEFLEKARNGEMIPSDVIIRYATYFQDDLTLDNMPRMQLINMCRYMSIAPYGSDSFLRFQLRHRIRNLKEDDQRILWEGIESLTKMELREACQERGMRSTGLSKDTYRKALQQWLDLSVSYKVPISLLVMSRTFFLDKEMFEAKSEDQTQSLAGIADAISGLDKEVLNEVILEVATSEEKQSDKNVRQIKLDVLSQQNELIREEQEARDAARDAAAKKKESPEKESSEIDVASDPLSASEAPTAATEPMESKPIQAESEDEVTTKTAEDEEEPSGLSTEEMDAIAHLVSEDPVSKETAELGRIKAAMKSEESVEGAREGSEISDEKVFSDTKFEVPPEQSTASVDSTVPGMESGLQDVGKEAQVSTDGRAPVEATDESPVDREEIDDPVVARLKKRLESMVDKIEVQLSDVRVKIGDKLHMLDKNRDGILSHEEIAHALQEVLKREITFDEAMEIANGMDRNHDGIITVNELINWIDEHKLVKFVEEGRDADMDRIIENQSVDMKAEELAPSETAANKQ